MEQVKIAVAGAGLIGKTHIKLVSENAQCQLASIVDPSPGAKEVADEYGVKVYASLKNPFRPS